MRNRYGQLSLWDIYKSVEEHLENDKPELFRLLDEHLDWDDIIPDTFYSAFYLETGRKRKYELESFMRALFLQRIFHYVEDTQLLNTLRFSCEMRDYCGFDKIPDASKLTRFKQDFCSHIRDVFERLVILTEPVCREMDEALSDILLFDTTGIESYVAENNPKFPRTKAGEAFGYSGAAASNPQVKLQYINGHMCYAQRAVVITNGLGIVRHLELLDEDFRQKHPEVPRLPRAKSPEIDKEIGDSTALKPVLMDFRAAHPDLHYSTFCGDAAFDSYDNYSFLLGEYRFTRAVIPMNPRNSATSGNEQFNENGTPLCPLDGTPFNPKGSANGNHRSLRLKFLCPKSFLRKASNDRYTYVCHCQTPCTDSKYGKCVYVYPNKNLRLYPGISRDDPKFEAVYKQRTAVERSINTLKDTLGVQGRKTSNTLTTKADLFLAGIVQLLCVLLAHKLHDTKLARRPRKLIA
ncbi:MAG: transposase [Oscillospiraceae bacterium]